MKNNLDRFSFKTRMKISLIKQSWILWKTKAINKREFLLRLHAILFKMTTAKLSPNCNFQVDDFLFVKSPEEKKPQKRKTVLIDLFPVNDLHKCMELSLSHKEALNQPVTVLGCGCVFYHRQNTIVYVGMCQRHSIREYILNHSF